MPEPWRYLQALGLAAGVGGVVAWALALLGGVLRRGQSGPRPSGQPAPGWPGGPALAVAVGLPLGLIVGYGWLGVRWNGPPANGLNRLLWLVLPATLLIELVIASAPSPARWGWWLRGALALLVPRVLLHGSVHLATGGVFPGTTRAGWLGWPGLTAGIELLGLGAGLLAAWWLLDWLAARAGGEGVPVALVLALLATGACVMLGGYLKGGAAAFPLAGAVLGTPWGAWLWQRLSTGTGRGRGGAVAGDSARSSVVALGVVGLGVVGLFGLLLVGCAFGRLLPGRAVALGLAPLLSAAPLGPRARKWGWWCMLAVRLLLVAALLGLVVAVAKIDFDRNFRPLLGAGAASLHGRELEGTTAGTETDRGAGEATRRATRGHFQPTG
ncbi:MAG: hypothetical protein ACKO3P_18685, partial [Planctomycetaceae bacterium]